MLNRNKILTTLLYSRNQSFCFFIRDIKYLSIRQWEGESNDLPTSHLIVRQQKVTK